MTDRAAVLPQLHYVDAKAAVDWLCRVFGFKEESRMEGPEGTVYIADHRGPAGGAVMVSGLTDSLKERMRSRSST